jgi:hypothetical protein
MLDNCKECGKLFNKIHRPYCAECEEMIDGYYEKIRDFIYENGEATVFEIHEATGVSEKWIMRLRDEGRLLDCDIMYKCECCGIHTKGVRICDRCASQLKQGLNSKKQNIVNPARMGYYSEKRR